MAFMKLQRKRIAAMIRARFNRVKPVNELTLADMLIYPWRYNGLSDGLAQLPTPEYITIGRKRYPVPTTMEHFGDTITYGQKMWFQRGEQSDIGLVFRYIAGYYTPMVTGETWDEKNITRIEKIIVNSLAIEMYPAAYHLIDLMTQLVERELKLLQREPTKQERAAGIEKLGKYAELMAITFLMDQFKCSESDVMAKPYNDCLVRFMLQRDQNAYADRLADVYKRENESKTKSK